MYFSCALQPLAIINHSLSLNRSCDPQAMSSELAFLLHSQAKCPINCMGQPMQMKIHVKISNN